MARQTATATTPRKSVSARRGDELIEARQLIPGRRAAQAAARRASATTVLDAPEPLTRADEARLQREQQVLERGEAMTPDRTLDRDLAHLADPQAGKRTAPARRRHPDEEGLVYRGKRQGMLHDQDIDILVPDEDNDARVAELQSVIPGMDEDSQHEAWAVRAEKTRATGKEPAPYVPVRDRLNISGIPYHFKLGQTTLVHEDDVDYVLDYPAYRIERATAISTSDVLPHERARGGVATPGARRAR